ncbi:hypothetical protein MKQ68_04590 [Chitinophaga horti]|uniref:Uncharacterized protein n=1 Tax=Chitinophaga horti TaxID=2920382 RepID=A0ABY6J4S9_9BACT|nr:hypothetical protein [Chitinophaga horti]UYQ94366.1 hypothetical protein MKQ68_04590 [Chitinophaga horti]
MNIAIGTLLLFLLVIPGISFRNAYYFGPLSKKLSKSSAFDDFIWAIIPGILFQLLFAGLVNRVQPWGYTVDFHSLGRILFNSQESAREFGKLGGHIVPILSYNAILIVLAGIFGYAVRLGIRRLHLDHYFQFLRFSNQWFYFLRGESTLFKENRVEGEARPEIDTCTVQAVVKLEDGCYIYTGNVDSFELSNAGELDYIVLYGASRRKFDEVGETDDYIIPADIVILKHAEIITLSVKVEYFREIEIVETAEDVNALDDVKTRYEQAQAELQEAQNWLRDAEAEYDMKKQAAGQARLNPGVLQRATEAITTLSETNEQLEAAKNAQQAEMEAAKILETANIAVFEADRAERLAYADWIRQEAESRQAPTSINN